MQYIFNFYIDEKNSWKLIKKEQTSTILLTLGMITSFGV